MNHFKPTPVRVQHRIEADKFYDSSIEVERLAPPARLLAAFVALGICWFAAILFVFIPVLHFVLVPLALIGGIVVFITRFNLHLRRRSIELKCPACQAPLPIKAGSFNFPMKESCGSCRSSLIITEI